jgi:hypothetical protein
MTFLEERKNPDSNTVMTAQKELVFLEAVVVLAVVVELRLIKTRNVPSRKHEMDTLTTGRGTL